MAKTIEENIQTIEKNRKLIKLVKSLRDQLPHDEFYWRQMNTSINNLTDRYGFKRLETPLVENTNVFVKTLGKHHSLVKEQLFNFDDDQGNNYAFRPEFTPAVVRSYLEHGFFNDRFQPYKVFSIGPVLRRSVQNPSKLKQFHQFNCESIGQDDPVVDAQLILLGYNFLKELGLDPTVHINSWGVVEEYKPNLVQYLRQKKKLIPAEYHQYITKEPWRVFMAQDEECFNVRMDAPQTVDYLDDKSRDHFIKVLEYLDELEIPYVLDPFLRRKQDYYTRTVFEFIDDSDDNDILNFGGGGRYDNLINEFSGIEAAGAGFAFNLDHLCRILVDSKKPKEHPEIFLAQLGDKAKKKALLLFEDLQRNGIKVIEDFSKNNLKLQLERANKLNIKLVLVLGQKEVLDNTVIIRDMEGGIQETIDYKKIIGELNKRLKTA